MLPLRLSLLVMLPVLTFISGMSLWSTANTRGGSVVIPDGSRADTAQLRRHQFAEVLRDESLPTLLRFLHHAAYGRSDAIRVAAETCLQDPILTADDCSSILPENLRGDVCADVEETA
jgi:hypothetical protein